MTATETRIEYAYMDLFIALLRVQGTTPYASSLEVKFPANKWALLHRLIAEEDAAYGCTTGG